MVLKVFLQLLKDILTVISDDFGNSRSYGYKRVHLGNDLLGSIGTPIIAIEVWLCRSLRLESIWGWRIGIRSFDGLKILLLCTFKKKTTLIIQKL